MPLFRVTLLHLRRIHRTFFQRSEVLTDNLLSIIHVFSCRRYGTRRYKKEGGAEKGPEGQDPPQQGTGPDTEGVVQGRQDHVQPAHLLMIEHRGTFTVVSDSTTYSASGDVPLYLSSTFRQTVDIDQESP